MGSKSRIAKYIVPIIQSYIKEGDIYIEPFAGGMNVIDKVKAKDRIAYDINEYLIALFLHIKNGGELLDVVDRKLYCDVRSSYKNDDCIYPKWMVGNVGFLASYNGRWFDGGYAKSGYEKTKNGMRFRDYYKESKNNLEAQAENLKDIMFISNDYRCLNINNIKNAVIYCDPPYKNTKKYKNSENFDYNEFWDAMRLWSKDNIVIVSELEAPDDFIKIWEKSVSRSIKVDNKVKSTEKIFIHKNTIKDGYLWATNNSF